MISAESTVDEIEEWSDQLEESMRRSSDDHRRCYQPVEGEERNRESERRREQVCEENRKREEN